MAGCGPRFGVSRVAGMGALPLCLVLTAAFVSSAFAAQPDPDVGPEPRETAPVSPEEPPSVTFSFLEPIEIRELVDYVSRRTGMQFLYDERLTGRVMLQSPTSVPVSSLPNLLASVLRFKGLTLVEREGWYRIIKIQGLPSEAGLAEAEKVPEGEVPATVVVRLEHADAAKVFAAVKPMLSEPGGNGIVVAEWNLLILTDFSDNLRTARELMRLLDE